MSRSLRLVRSFLAAGVAPALLLAQAAAAEPPAVAAAVPAQAAAVPALPLEPAVPGGLTAEQVAERAVHTSPGLRADREESAAQAHAWRRHVLPFCRA